MRAIRIPLGGISRSSPLRHRLLSDPPHRRHRRLLRLKVLIDDKTLAVSFAGGKFILITTTNDIVKPPLAAGPMCIVATDAIAFFLSHIEQCLATKNLKLGHCLHACLIKTALTQHTLIANRLIDLYSSLDVAYRFFDQISCRNLVSYNTMISSLTHHGHHEEALDLFAQMRKDIIIMDKFTVVGISIACASLLALRCLRQLHALIIVSGLELNLIMSNVMIDAYGKCGDVDASHCLFDRMKRRDVVSWTSMVRAYASACRLEEARAVFASMPERNVVSWTALISGYEQNGEEEAALELFTQMMAEGVVPTPFTLVSILSACASLGLIERGKQVHGFTFRRFIGLDSFNVFIFNALIDLYAKCGNMVSASIVFDRMPDRDIVSWNSIVSGFAQNGHGKQSLDVFERMVKAGVEPNHVTFLGVLSACSHAGLASEGCRMLSLMEKDYGICPRAEHYGALIDTLGRKCQLKEAMQFIECLASGGDLAGVGTWGAILGACRVHGNLEIANIAAESLFKLDPKNGARYTMLSNIYAAAGLWDDVRRVRLLMKDKRLKKGAGYSWLEVRSAKHMFVAYDKSHYQAEEIYSLLATLVDHMIDARDSVEYKQCHVSVNDNY
ncbi:PPR repeat [Musa troglodytarum]|uniref:PPR repeat n=1 Tax=Musa troglodytarum TaxID=320322 RepID=A0A9E7GDU8_9LILI|nr:PPR repeat [Musa troglodytarum]